MTRQEKEALKRRNDNRFAFSSGGFLFSLLLFALAPADAKGYALLCLVMWFASVLVAWEVCRKSDSGEDK